MVIITFILNYWKKQTGKEKIFIVLLILILLYSIGKTAQSAFYKYKYYREVEQKYTTLKDSLRAVNERTTVTIQKGKIRTKIVQKNLSKIDNKLKIDEKIIDSSDVSDDDIRAFIAEHN